MLDAFLKLLAGERPRRIVWMADIAYWIAGQQQAGTAKPQWSTEEGFLQLHQELGILPYYYYEPGKFWAAEPRYDSCVEVMEAEEGDKSIRRFRTPVGEIWEESVYSPLSCSVGITKHFVEVGARPGRSAVHPAASPFGAAAWPIGPSAAGCGRRMAACRSIGLVRSPLAAFLVEWAGVQSGSYLLIDCPEKFAEFSR